MRQDDDNAVLKSTDINTAFLEFIGGSWSEKEHNLCKRSQRSHDEECEEGVHFVFAIVQDEQDIVVTFV